MSRACRLSATPTVLARTLSPRPLRIGLLSTPDAASVIPSGCVSLFSRTCRAWMDATAVLLLRQPAEVHRGLMAAQPRRSRAAIREISFGGRFHRLLMTWSPFGAFPVSRPFSHGRDAPHEGQLRVAALAALATDPNPLRWTTGEYNRTGRAHHEGADVGSKHRWNPPMSPMQSSTDD
jgi:hypothetical protein